jgi:hypothetical protein
MHFSLKYLFLQMDIKSLHGKVLNMADRTKEMGRIVVDDNCYALKHDAELQSSFRPIVKNLVTESSCLGPSFAGGVHIVQRVIMDETPGEAPLPVSLHVLRVIL